MKFLIIIFRKIKKKTSASLLDNKTCVTNIISQLRGRAQSPINLLRLPYNPNWSRCDNCLRLKSVKISSLRLVSHYALFAWISIWCHHNCKLKTYFTIKTYYMPKVKIISVAKKSQQTFFLTYNNCALFV